MSTETNDSREFSGIESLIYRYNEETSEYDRIRAELLYMRKGTDAKLDIISEDGIPDWITPGIYISLNVVWPSKGLVVFTGTVTYILGSRIHIGDLEFLETIQRRKDVKVKYASRGTVSTLDGQYRFHILFENISAGGVGFKFLSDGYSRQIIQPGAEMMLEFEPEDSRPVQLSMTIVRTTGNDDKGLIHAGAQFETMRHGTEVQLRQLVFRCQKEENTRERELRSSGMIEIDVFMNGK